MKTSDIELIENHLQSADKNTLVIFDVDDVLMQPQDQILRSSYNSLLENYEKFIDLHFTKEEACELYSLIWLQRSIEPIHPKFVYLIRRLCKRGIKVLALTNCITGKFGYIPSVEDWRIHEPKSLGYHFEQCWKGVPKIVFDQLVTPDSKKVSIYKEGVIFTHGIPKGKILNAFLSYLPHTPKSIIFIDDLVINLKSVEAATHALGIEFKGIEYTAVKESKLEPLNVSCAKLQFETLLKERKWLSDQKINTLEENFLLDEPIKNQEK